MNILDNIRAKKASVHANTMVSITETGHRAADADSEVGDGFAILSRLDDQSPQSVGSLARGTGIDVFRTTKIVDRLRGQGKVSIQDAGES